MKTIERAIHHANKQLVSSKKLLNMASAKCLPIVVNDGNYFFSNEQMVAAICNVMSRKFIDSVIDGFIYLTVNQSSMIINSNLDWQVWIPVYRDENDRKLATFVNLLGERFNDFLTYYTGGPAKEYQQIKDTNLGIKVLASMKYLPKKLIYKK